MLYKMALGWPLWQVVSLSIIILLMPKLAASVHVYNVSISKETGSCNRFLAASFKGPNTSRATCEH
jgi:hypothetical protein